MKKTTLIALFVAVFGLLLVSCTRDITEPVMSSNPTTPTLADVSFTGQFTTPYTDSTFKFSWSASDFGFKSSTSYTVQLSSTSDFSGNVADLVTTQNLNANVKVGNINLLLLSWNFSIGSNAKVYYRVGASVSPNAPAAYSGIKSTTLVPFSAYPIIYVPGSYQGWTPGADNGRLYSYKINTEYSNIVRIKDGNNPTTQFKITSSPDWNHTNWGGTLTKTGNNYSGTLDPSGGNFEVVSAVYAITVNTGTLTISLTKTDDWGIIGSATAGGWGSSTPMFYNGERKMWEITANFTGDEFKFRANDAWDLNYGDDGNKNGGLKQGGDNIKLPSAGNYTIRFDPVALTYTVKKN